MLSLHHMTATDLDACRLIEEAAEQGCQAVSIFTHAPIGMPVDFPAVTQAALSAISDRLMSLHIALLNAEYFPLLPQTNIEDYRHGLELAARLGAKRATTHVQIEDVNERSERFAAFCELCNEFGIVLALEFTSTAKVNTLEAALELVAKAGYGKAVLTLDVLHAARTGVTPQQIAAIDPHLLGVVQICDGPTTMPVHQLRAESLQNRLPPGEGQLPLVAMLRCVPPDAPVEVEVPQQDARAAGVSPEERIRRAVMGAHRVLKSVADLALHPVGGEPG